MDKNVCICEVHNGECKLCPRPSLAPTLSLGLGRLCLQWVLKIPFKMLRANNETGYISLITLDHAWPKQDRLLFTVGGSIFGFVMNAFFIAAFFTDDYLKRIGLVFQASVGLSDMIVSMGVIPVSAYVLLSGLGDTANVCVALQFLIEASTYSYSIFFAMMTIENYLRVCRPGQIYETFVSKRIELICLIVLLITFTFAGVGAFQKLDYDSCSRSHSGNFVYRSFTNITFHFTSCLISVFCLVFTCLEMNNRADTNMHYRRSRQYQIDRHGHFANIVAYVLYVGAWSPFLILLNSYPATNDRKFYHSVWVGVGRSIITSFLYGILDGNFRRAYGHLFNYLCCKKAMSNRVVRHHRRAAEYRAAAL